MQLIRSHAQHKDFKKLVSDLDSYLAKTDGEEHDFYNQFNGLENLTAVVIAYLNNEPVGCGAFKKYDRSSAEIKRMFVKPAYRGKKIASYMLVALEKWAAEQGFKNCILETGKRQVEAVKFYQKCKYEVITNYGQYQGRANSICFKKTLL